jgi:hypothetical protein
VSLNVLGINQILKLTIMLTNILKLEGTEKLTKTEQKSIKGGSAPVCEEGYTAKRCFVGGGHWECLPYGYPFNC